MKPRRIDEEHVLIFFAYTHILVIFLLPHVWDIDINTWTQLLAYVGGFLLGVQFLGDARIGSADKSLSENVVQLKRTLNRFICYYYLIKEEEEGDRKEVGLWYLWGVIDAALILFFLLYAAPNWIGITGKQILDEHKWILYLLAFSPVLHIPIRLLAYRALQGNTRMIVLKTSLYLWFVPCALLLGWITLPWLLVVGLSWLLLMGFLIVVQLKKSLRMGNVFYVLGTMFLGLSFILFLVENI